MVTENGEHISGNNLKTFTLSDVKITKDKDGNIIMQPSLGTKFVNSIVNGGKEFFRDTNIGKWINDKIGQKRSQKLTTEPYGVYKNEQVLKNSVTDKNSNYIDLHGLSGNLNNYKGTPEGKKYLEDIK